MGAAGIQGQQPNLSDEGGKGKKKKVRAPRGFGFVLFSLLSSNVDPS